MNREYDCYDILFTIHCEAILPDGRRISEITHRKTEEEAQDEIAYFKKRYTNTRTYYDFEYKVRGRITIL